MAQGSNELNALLKAKVVQIKAELDVKGSLPKIKSQIDEISKLLEGKPVKLRVELDHKNSHLTTQIDALSKKLENKHLKLNVKFDMTVKDAVNQFNEIQKKVTGSKSFQPIKIDVQIDVKGSADNIKKQLKDVHDTVTDFNKKYGQQLAQMQQKAQQTQNKMKSIQNGAVNPVPTNGQLGGFNLKQYASQIKDAEQQLRASFGKGLFSSHEMKDAEGNLQGFIASLSKANGVVQKIHYQWNADQKTFTPISQQTITNMEKSLHKAKQLLQSTYADIEKLKDGGGKDTLFQEFNNLEKRIGHNTLTEDAVKNLQRMIKEEGVLQQQIKQATEETKKQNRELLTQEKLIHNIEKAMNKDFKRTTNVDRRNQFKDLKSQVQADPENAQKYAFQLQKINEEISREIQKEKELARIEEKKLSFQEQVRKLKANTTSTDRTSQVLLRELDTTIKLARTNKDFYEIKKKIASVKTSNNNAQDIQKIEAMSEKVKESLRQLNDRGLITSQKLEEALSKVPQTAMRGLQDLTNQYNAIQRRISKSKAEDKRRDANSNILVSDKGEREKLQAVVKSNDITNVQKYVEALYKGKVETISMRETTDTLGRAVTELDVKMKGTGKQVKSYTLQMENANGTLRQTAQATSFNANRNLGVFEQLKIAMARVPVWMASMTAFYGTLRTLQNFGQEILKVDKSMTELRRVASSNINIETVFDGAVNLSAELGNNIHDIMGAVNDLARTYGDFNERQLIAVARTATLMSNVSDLSMEEATNSLVGTMNAFNIEAEDSIRIVDSLNEVDNDYAISTKQLAEGLQKASSTASTFGVTMEENVGHITAIGAVTMESGAIIGNSLKTIYSRITTVNEAKGALEGVGVEMYKIGENGQKSIKPVNDILKDLAGRWGELSAEQKQNLAVTVAGRYQLSRFLALMNNWDTATKATDTALTSQGSAIRENAKYMESFEARINKLKNAFTELALSMGRAFMNNGMSLLISGLTDLAKLAVDIVDKFGALPIVIGVVGLLAQKMGLFSGTITEIRQAITRYRASMVAMQATTVQTATTTTVATGATSRLGIAMTGAVTRVRALNLAMKGLLASSVVGVVFVGIGIALEKLMGYMEKQRQIAEKTAKVNKQLVDSYRNTEGGLENLISEQQRLQDAVDAPNSSIKRGTSEWTKYVEITNKLAQKMPSIVKYVDQEGLAHLQTADAIKEQLKYAEELSQVQANKEQIDFNTNLAKQLKAYDDEMAKIKKLKKEKQSLKDLDGKDQYIATPAGVVKTGLLENTKGKQQEKNIEIINSEMKVQGILQKTMNMVQNTTLAYLESKKKLKDMTDSGRTVVESMVQQNEELLKLNKNGGKLTSDEISANADALLGKAKDVGNFISDTYAKMTEGVKDPLKLQEIKGNLDGLIDALPDTFFKAETFDDMDKVQEKFKGILSIADQVEAGTGDFNGLTDSLERIGFTSDEAKAYVTKLGLQYDNAKIKSQALTQAQNEGSDSLENWVDTAIKAIDTSEQLFNITDEDTSALKSHIENLQQLKLVYGDNAKNVQSYKDSLEAISLYTGLPEDVISKDTNYLHNVVDLVGKAQLKYDDATGALVGFNKEGLNKNQVNMLNQIVSVGKEGGATYDLFTGKITRVKDGVELVFDKTGKLVEKVKEANKALTEKPTNGQKQTVDETSKALDGVKSKIDATKNTKLFNEEDTSSDNLKLKVNGVEDALKKMQDRSYELKQQQIFGDEPNATVVKKAIDDTGESADVAQQKMDNFKRKTAKIFEEPPKTDGTKAKINDLVESIKKATSGAELLGKLNSVIDGTAKKLGNLLSKVKDVASGIGGISSKSSSISKSVKAIASAYESLSSKSSTASSKVKQAIDNQKKALTGLKKSSEEAKSSVNKSFTSMASAVSKSTNTMISKHHAQKSAINDLKDASNRARSAISNLNSSMDNAMGSLDRYISKASVARSAGNSVPSASHFAVDSLSIPNTNGLTGGISYGGESFASAMSTVAGIGGATGGGDSGTSGTIVPPKPTFIGYRTIEGGFEASAVKKYNMRDYSSGSSSSKSSSSKSSSSSKKSSSTSSSKKATEEKKKNSKTIQKENIAEAYTFNALERAVNAYDVQINLANSSLEMYDKNTLKYRDGLRKVIALENSKIATMKKDLAQTEARNKSIQAQLKKLPSVGKQNAKQRDQYNKLMQEYDTNLGKIGGLKQEIASLGNDVKQQSLEIFNDFVDQIVSSYDKAIKAIEGKLDDLDFNKQVIELTDPTNKKAILDADVKIANESHNEQKKAQEKVNALDKTYKDEAKKQGQINAKEEKKALDDEKAKQKKLNKVREDAIKKAQAKYNADVKKYGKNSKQAKASKATVDKLVADDKKKDTEGANKIKALQKKYDDALKSGANSKTAQKAKEELDKAKEDLEDATIKALQADKEVKDARLEIANESIDALKDYYKQQKEMAVDAIDKQIDLEQKAHDKKMEQYDEEVNGINAIYDAKFKKMDEDKDKQNYEQELADKNKKKSELVNKISLLSRDNSVEGKKKVADLQAQLEELNKEINNFQTDRADQVLRDSLTQQKDDAITAINGGYDANGNKIQGTKEKDQELFDQQMENLNKQKEEVSKYYDDLVNNEAHWQQIRDDATKGSFTLLNTEMTAMGTNIQNMQKGIFDGLFAGFSGLSDEVKKYVAEVNGINVDNIDLETKQAIKDVKSVTPAPTPPKSGGKVTTQPVTPPKNTTPPNTTQPVTPPKKDNGGKYTTQPTNPPKKDDGKKNTTQPPKEQVDRKTTTALSMRKSPAYGNNIIYNLPKGTKVDYIGMEKGWAKIKYKGKTGYVGAKYLQKFDTGGYTGDWVGNEGRMAMLHKKELVLNERQTSDILNVAKIMDKVKSVIPDLKRNILAKDFAEGEGTTNITNYNLTVNIDTLTGDKKGADTVVKEIMKGLKKRGH